MHYILCLTGQEGPNLVLGWPRWRRYCHSFLHDHLALVSNYHVCILDMPWELSTFRGNVIIWMPSLDIVLPWWVVFENYCLNGYGRWIWRLWQIGRKRTCLSSKLFLNDHTFPLDLYALYVLKKWYFCTGFFKLWDSQMQRPRTFREQIILDRIMNLYFNFISVIRFFSKIVRNCCIPCCKFRTYFLEPLKNLLSRVLCFWLCINHWFDRYMEDYNTATFPSKK
jgi:hypothetical protein